MRLLLLCLLVMLSQWRCVGSLVNELLKSLPDLCRLTDQMLRFFTRKTTLFPWKSLHSSSVGSSMWLSMEWLMSKYLMINDLINLRWINDTSGTYHPSELLKVSQTLPTNEEVTWLWENAGWGFFLLIQRELFGKVRREHSGCGSAGGHGVLGKVQVWICGPKDLNPLLLGLWDWRGSGGKRGRSH